MEENRSNSAGAFVRYCLMNELVQTIRLKD